MSAEIDFGVRLQKSVLNGIDKIYKNRKGKQIYNRKLTKTFVISMLVRMRSTASIYELMAVSIYSYRCPSALYEIHGDD